jgi:hypothetical protein
MRFSFMRLRLEKYSYRFAEQVLNSKLQLKQEIESILLDSSIDIPTLSRPNFNEVLKGLFVAKNWYNQPAVFGEINDPTAKLDFFKERIGIEVQFGHSSFIGIDLLKFQVSSYSNLDKIDVGIYVVTTKKFQKVMKEEYNNTWEGSLNFEKVIKYLPHFKSAIQVPIYVIGFDV